ncbi:PAS domain S-box protein [Bacillus pseudomycoides]|nr:PAS domain S-box protein [Bacillus pseudomycoides]
MSEIINNREQKSINKFERQTILKEIIKNLHNGKSVEEVKAQFEEAVGNITVAEISKLEQALMEEEGIPVEEVQRLCSVHTAIFKGSIEEIHRSDKPEDQAGHPVHTFKLENKEIDKLVNFKLQLHYERFEKEDSEENIYKLIEDLNLLLDVDKHYSRKENLLFPYLEKYGIFGPTQVMWGIDDVIRNAIKDVKQILTTYNGDKKTVLDGIYFVIREVTELIFKEENILFPMALQTLTEDEWVKIAHESDEIGYCLTGPASEWKPERKAIQEQAISEGFIRLETGILSLKQLELMLNHLPVDITYINQDDVVRYFSHGKERIFARTKAIIGRTVQNCHPPKSVHVVEKLLEDFKSGNKDCEDFWIKLKDKYVYIRYFAIRSENGEYMGTLEFTQNINPIQEIQGEKRILS